MNLSEEQRYVVRQFKTNFSSTEFASIVLYGIGRNTEAILSCCGEMPIDGLMDAEAASRTLFGKKLLSFDEVIDLKSSIVIVARDSVLPIIYKRIAFLEDKGITIYSLDGARFEQREFAYRNGDLPYWNVTEEDLKREIDAHDVISFDIFDTLVMRQVLKPSDIFSLAARRFARKHKNQNDMDIQLISQIEDTFPEIRAAAEKQKGIEKTIHDYYGKIEQKYQIPSAVMEELKDIEFQVELEYMIPRKKMTELFHYALSSGKTVYVISDMYYTEAQLRMLLAHCGIKGDFPILVSCEHHASKEAGTLFPLFTGLFENSAVPVRHRFLHIGDNRLADKAMAEAAGIDSFIVMSAYELLTASSIQQLLSETGDSEYNKILGFYISTAFNDPFALSRTKGCVVIESLFDIGRYCIAPLLFEYMFWLKNRLIESKIEQMIFSSRDGYVPCMLYRIMRKEFPELPEPVYLKTSRRAVTVAAIKNTSDILRLAERPFRGTIGDFFVQRYGIEIEENDAPLEWQFCDDLVVLLEKYSSVILQNAVLERRSYMDYLKQMNIISSCKKGFFDFVAGGTVQYYLEKLLGERLQGYYFATMNLPNPMYRMDDIDAAYGNITSYGSNHPFARYYLMLESILTDPDSTFVKIDEYGNFVFTENINTIYDQIKPVHDGVLYYFNERFALEYRDMINKNPSLRGAEKLFGVLFDETCKIPDKLKAVFKNDDIYDGQRLYQSFSA